MEPHLVDFTDYKMLTALRGTKVTKKKRLVHQNAYHKIYGTFKKQSRIKNTSEWARFIPNCISANMNTWKISPSLLILCISLLEVGESYGQSAYCTRNRTTIIDVPVMKTRLVEQKPTGFLKMFSKSKFQVEQFIEHEQRLSWKLAQECCKGYEMTPAGVCEPMCRQGCGENAVCQSPGQCACEPFYKPAANSNQELLKCVPDCGVVCTKHSICIAPNECRCALGYRKMNHECVPMCRSGCPNGFCLESEMCVCHIGYLFQGGTCKKKRLKAIAKEAAVDAVPDDDSEGRISVAKESTKFQNNKNKTASKGKDAQQYNYKTYIEKDMIPEVNEYIERDPEPTRRTPEDTTFKNPVLNEVVTILNTTFMEVKTLEDNLNDIQIVESTSLPTDASQTTPEQPKEYKTVKSIIKKIAKKNEDNIVISKNANKGANKDVDKGSKKNDVKKSGKETDNDADKKPNKKFENDADKGADKGANKDVNKGANKDTDKSFNMDANKKQKKKADKIADKGVDKVPDKNSNNHVVTKTIRERTSTSAPSTTTTISNHILKSAENYSNYGVKDEGDEFWTTVLLASASIIFIFFVVSIIYWLGCKRRGIFKVKEKSEYYCEYQNHKKYNELRCN